MTEARAVLLSSEPWDAVWRRNQQLASRIPGTVFVEPARKGVRPRWREPDGVAVLTPAKPLPLRWPSGTALHARTTAAAIRERFPRDRLVAWTTHAAMAPLARALQAPIVYDRTDDWPAMEQSLVAQRRVRALDEQLLRDADAVVVVTREMLVAAGREASHIPNGVDAKAFAQPEHRTLTGHLRVGFAGTVDPFRVDMDILGAIAAAAEVTLVVAGPGRRVAGAENHGVMPHAQLPELLQTCDALVAPYRLDCTANHTSDALKLYEYFATGLPVIATPTAGFQRFPDLVTYWPAQPSLRDAVESLRQSATSRREVAQHSDWNERAAAMRQVLVTVAGLW